MYVYLEIVDVVANAFMELLKNERREILYYELDEYGAKAVEVLNREEDMHAMYIVSRESQHAICVDYSDYFEEFTDDEKNARGIRLKEGVDSQAIWTRFCVALSIKVLRAFRNQETVSVLG